MNEEYRTISDDKKSYYKQLAAAELSYQFNNKSFVYKQSYQQNQLLNGVTLKFIEAKGITNNIKQIGYLLSNQDLIFFAGSNIVGFNSQKKIHQIYASARNVQILKTFYFKAIQKQYIVWVQNHAKKKLLIVVETITKQRIYQSEIDINHKIFHISLSFSYGKHLFERHPIIGYITEVDSVDVFYYCLMNNHYQPTYSCTQIIYQLNELKISSDTMQPIFIYHNKLLSIRFQINKLQGKIQIEIFKYLQCIQGDIIVYDINDYMIVVVTEQFLCLYSITEKKLLYKYQLCVIFQLNPHLLLVNDIKINQSSMILVHKDELSISAFNISQGGAKFISCNTLELQNLNQIIKIFINPYNPQITSITQHHPALLHKTSNDISNDSFELLFSQKKSRYFQITTSHMTLTNVRGSFNKTDLKMQKYENIMICPWIAQPFIQTQRSILSKNIDADLGCLIKCSALHPSGLQILIGMNDCFRIYFITFQKLHFSYVSQPIKQCQAVAYSYYGNYFAVSSSSIINIYCSKSYRKVKSMIYSSNALIQRVWFDEQNFYCMLKGKRFIQYDINQYKQILSFNPKSYSESIQQSSIKSLFYDKFYGVVILGVNNKIMFLNTENYESIGNFEFPTVTCMEYSKILKTLFLGTQNGTILCFPWPNKPSQIRNKHPSFNFHQGPVKLIKVTSNNKYLLSASSQGSLYKCQLHIYSGMKKLKTFQLIQENKQYLNEMSNFLKQNGIAPFTHNQKNKKFQLIKQLQQQAKNREFMYPEQSSKQRVGILDNIQTKRNDFYQASEVQIDPLKKKTVQIKKNCFGLKKQIQSQENSFRQNIDRINTEFQKKLNELIKDRQQLQIQYDRVARQNQKQLSTTKQKYRIMKQQQRIKNIQGLENHQQIVEETSQNSVNILNSFMELNEIVEEKNIEMQKSTKNLNYTIQSVRSRNGLLNCRNAQIQKEIYKLKRKIEESVDMIFHIKQSLQKIEKKTVKLTNEDDGTMCKVYREAHHETKQLIKRDKQIDINIHYFERQKSILIELERILQRTQKEIQKVVEDNFDNKKIAKNLQQKLSQMKIKRSNFQKKSKKNKINKINSQNKLKDFAKLINLYIDGTISKNELKQHLAVIKQVNKGAISQRENTIKMEQHVAKSLTQEQKIYKMMKNGKKIYANSLRKMNTQNQDLLNSFNNLSYEHKYLSSIIKTEDEKIRKTCQQIQYIPIKKKGTKDTPFQKYILNKAKPQNTNRGPQRRLKTLPANQYHF